MEAKAVSVVIVVAAMVGLPVMLKVVAAMVARVRPEGSVAALHVAVPAVELVAMASMEVVALMALVLVALAAASDYLEAKAEGALGA